MLILDLVRPEYVEEGVAVGGHTEELDPFISAFNRGREGGRPLYRYEARKVKEMTSRDDVEKNRFLACCRSSVIVCQCLFSLLYIHLPLSTNTLVSPFQ